MSDEADLAQIHIERDLEIAIEQARSHSRESRYCQDCGEALAPHRQPWGVCLECKIAREAHARQFTMRT